MKQPVQARPLTLDKNPPPLNLLRSTVVAIAVCLAFAAVIYFAMG